VVPEREKKIISFIKSEIIPALIPTIMMISTAVVMEEAEALNPVNGIFEKSNVFYDIDYLDKIKSFINNQDYVA
jgi:hypothetical protein